MKIAVLDGHTLNPGDNPWEPVEKFGQLEIYDHTPPEQIVERMRGAEIAVTNKALLSAEAIEELPMLKFIAVTATGYNNVDIGAAKSRGIPVSNVPEYSTNSVAEFTFALLLELMHHIGQHTSAVYAGKWSAQPHFSFWETQQRELAGKILAVVGYGHIGKRVGEIAKAFGMEIISVGRGEARLLEIIARADIVTLHCPLTPETADMINKEFLSAMKPSAFLINAARGGLIVEQDLARALNDGKIAGAAVDVVSIEPIKSDNPLLKAKNCIITPHIAWATIEARKRLMQATAENIRAFIAGKPINVVNA